MRPTLLLAIALFAAACRPAPAPAAPANEARPPVAAGYALTGRVIDRAGLLRPEEEARLSSTSEALERRTTDQLVIVTVPSLGGRTIEALGLELGNGWRIGQEGKDNGVLIIVAPNERKVRIEVAYGLETILTNERAAQIIDEDLLPRLREERFADALYAGADAVAATLIARADAPRRAR